MPKQDDNLALLSEIAKLPTLAALHGAWVYQKHVIESHFSEGNQERFGWPPLTPAYAQRKAKKHGKQPMLVATKRLKKAVVGHGTVRSSGDTITIEWKGLPSYAGFVERDRPYFDPDSKDEQEILKAVERYISKVERTRGGVPPKPFQDV